MTINQRIKAALEPLGLPVVPDSDLEHRERCFTFNYDLQPTQWADGRPLLCRALVQVHLFLPLAENPLTLRRQAAKALAAAGFSHPEAVDASDNNSQHIVLETEIITDMEV